MTNAGIGNQIYKNWLKKRGGRKKLNEDNKTTTDNKTK